jgi:hypothetical protein
MLSTSENVSPAELLASLPPEQLVTFLKRTSDRELEAIEHAADSSSASAPRGSRIEAPYQARQRFVLGISWAAEERAEFYIGHLTA